MLIFLQEANDDFDAAFSYYASENLDLAVAFNVQLNDLLQRIDTTPQQFPKTLHNCRKAHLKKPFPYHIVFKIYADFTLIVAVAHDKREPAYWKQRT